MSIKTDLPLEKVKQVFCNETGYQTPKIETRAAMFREDEILLVKEETGLTVTPVRIIAILDRNKHNSPRYAYGIIKVFVLCSIIGGSFQPNIETQESSFFPLTDLPVLDEDKTTSHQIQMCFDAFHREKWEVIFD